MIRKAVSAWLPALLLFLSVAIPVLERSEMAHETAIESEHNPATCPPAHDHTVCTQVGANLAVVSAPTYVDHNHAVVRVPTPVEAPVSAHSAFEDGHPSRAPPLA